MSSAVAPPPEGRRRAARRWLTRHHVGRRLLIGVTALAGAVIAVSLFGSVHRSVGPVHGTFSVQPRWYGGTDVSIPPLGHLTFSSHTGPVHLQATVTGISLTDAKQLLQGGTSTDELEQQVTRDVRGIVIRLVIRTALLAVLGGGVTVLLVFRRTRAALLAVAVVVGAMGVSTVIAAASWDTKAFSQPRFSGLLTSAPTLIGSIDDIPNRFDTYRQELAKIVTNVSKLYDVTSALPAAISARAIPVLWVSDIHDNPEAFSVMKSLIAQFEIKAVADTGDLSDHGTSAENRLYTPISEFNVPYIYVRGNHDSTATQAFVASLPNAHVLGNGKVEQVAGLRWAGIGDPTFTPDQSVKQAASADADLVAAGKKLATAIRAASPPVDVALVHEPAMAPPLDGVVPLVLDGHTHQRDHRSSEKTVVITQGSSGGAGLRNLEGDQPLPLEMSVLYFDPDTRRLIAADEITLSGLGLESVSIQRHRAEYYAQNKGPTSSPTGSPTPSAR